MSDSDKVEIFEGDRVEVFSGASHELGEGALWSSSLQKFIHVDIYGPSKLSDKPGVFVHGPEGVRAYPTPSYCGTVAQSGPAHCLIALQDGIYELNLDSGAVELVCRPADKTDATRFNDGKAAPGNFFFAGTMGVPGAVHPGLGSLYRFSKSGAGRTLVAENLVSGITISNGLVWTKDSFFYIDTVLDRVDRFDYDVTTGAISNRRVAFAIPDTAKNGHPDGMTIDAEGNLWVAQWGGWKVVKYSQEGKILAEVRVPAAHVSSCCFGGPELKDLYITTAKEHLDEAARAAQPLAGNVFVVRNAGQGVPADEFKWD